MNYPKKNTYKERGNSRSEEPLHPSQETSGSIYNFPSLIKQRVTKRQQGQSYYIHFQLISYSNTSDVKSNSICSPFPPPSLEVRVVKFGFHVFLPNEKIFPCLVHYHVEAHLRVGSNPPSSEKFAFLFFPSDEERFMERDLFAEKTFLWDELQFTHRHWLDTHRHKYQQAFRDPLCKRHAGSKLNHTTNSSAHNRSTDEGNGEPKEIPVREKSMRGGKFFLLSIWCFPSHSVSRFAALSFCERDFSMTKWRQIT